MMVKSLQFLRQSREFRISLLGLCLTVTQRTTSAKEWMDRLQTRTNSMWEKLALVSNGDGPTAPFDRPVRIAVIDTGAAIEDSELEERYDNRLIECRSWVGEDPGRLVKRATSDAVGHGTHATSLALEVTENTDCEVYVAQCFEKSPQHKSLHGEDSDTVAEAIASVSLKDERLNSFTKQSQGNRVCGAALESRHNLPFLRHRSGCRHH
jgi:hypothetical protein